MLKETVGSLVTVCHYLSSEYAKNMPEMRLIVPGYETADANYMQAFGEKLRIIWQVEIISGNIT